MKYPEFEQDSDDDDSEEDDEDDEGDDDIKLPQIITKETKQKTEDSEVVVPAAAAPKKEVPAAAAKKEEKPAAKKEEKKAGLKTQVIAGGLEVTDSKVGTGAAAKSGNKVGMRYIGKLENGKVFDSNTKGAPLTFTLGRGQVIKGWDLGVAGMQVGGERKLKIPAKLAYGNQKIAGIPANSTLLFDVKVRPALLSVHRPTAQPDLTPSSRPHSSSRSSKRAWPDDRLLYPLLKSIELLRPMSEVFAERLERERGEPGARRQDSATTRRLSSAQTLALPTPASAKLSSNATRVYCTIQVAKAREGRARKLSSVAEEEEEDEERVVHTPSLDPLHRRKPPP
ncbi:uncharacterized protein RHOBADRAFT_11717 [Rhodotorula graminis WP1]|uniref:peptidylprolyl isomerase n=1 Tax=Rhodotorula graminis (strain WP1) TaxID=578459 RepID=A0A194SEF3_RHOGW|nr:uncharacterized protein RHOBADRAFT_11717 [Rhodotorula graminis WP1]KPV77876.1 hypothetical protein RHOBADRAFT_11717 [Rhodotorula graminis WP1]